MYGYMKKTIFVKSICFFFFIFLLIYTSFVKKYEINRPIEIIHAVNQGQIPSHKNKHPTPTQTPLPTPWITPTPILTITPTPAPIPRAIPHGNVIFTISGGNQRGPQVSRGSIDPYDPEYGATQKIQIYTDINQSNQSMRVMMNTDNGSVTVPLSLTATTSYFNIWEGTWTVTDSYLFTYKATVEATSENGTTIVPIFLR